MAPIDPRIVAHRGWTRTHLENTFEALEEAVSHGCRAIEFDVQETADGEWLVYHDEDLLRLHSSPQVLIESRIDEIDAVVRLPRLADVLPLFREGCTPMIEVKSADPPAFDGLVSVVGKHARDARTIVIAHGADMAERLALALPDAEIYLFETDWARAADVASSGVRGFDLLGARAPRDAEELQTVIRRLQAGGRGIAVWTINDPVEARRWLDLGCEWVITDVPWKMGA